MLEKCLSAELRLRRLVPGAAVRAKRRFLSSYWARENDIINENNDVVCLFFAQWFVTFLVKSRLLIDLILFLQIVHSLGELLPELSNPWRTRRTKTGNSTFNTW